MLKSQSGLAPVIIIIGLLSLGAVVAVGYFVTTQNKANPQVMQSVPVEKSAPTATQRPPIEQVKEMNESKLLELSGVTGVDVGEKDNKPCIVVFTFKETDELKKLGDNGLDGYQVKIENTPE